MRMIRYMKGDRIFEQIEKSNQIKKAKKHRPAFLFDSELNKLADEVKEIIEREEHENGSAE